MQNKTKALTVLADTNTRESLTLVGVTRLELVASWTRTMHATKLRYTPTFPLAVLLGFRVNVCYYNADG